ncbi:MAG TPA: TrkA family potassium uptake protein [Euryarchaeota archaeon]|nr:trk system potassium uptake protein TrkA [archaeon BMS3Abin16]GBE55808.1 trk system potassium uptake protein TrkA [archaeon BMS3Bbin16]HDH27644.1 TrkA family potassium uptake protein [Euryarchaeota archaeon]HDY73506.1 TrkA family potassium uptake protein [Euryarchaeota archaeon]
MNIIIVGAGRVGMFMAQKLEKDHEVSIVEKDKDLAQEASRALDVLVIQGDGTETKTLEEAGVKDADVIAGVTGKDEINMLSCLLAKSLGVKTVLARVGKPEYIEVFKSLGIDHVVSPELSVADRLYRLITRPTASDLALIEESDVEILEFTIQPNSLVKDKKVGEIPPNGFLIISVRKGDEIVIPTSTTVLEEKDKVWVLLKSQFIKNVTKLFVPPE